MPRRALPTTIWSQLGPLTVTYDSPVFGDDGDYCKGTYDPNTRRITVDRELSRTVKLQVLYHEAIHAWLLDASLNLGRKEEATVDTIANAIVNLLYPTR